MEADARAQLVDREASRYAAKGFEEVHRTRYTVVLEKKPFQIPTVLHIALCIPTLGFWLIVWGILAAVNKEPIRARIFVDGDGNVRVEESAWGRTNEKETS